MRPVTHEDPRQLLELHEQERDELTIREAIIDCLAELLWYRDNEDREGIDWSIERDFLRCEISDLRKLERRVQKFNGTALVLDPITYDREAGDDPAEMSDWDLDRLTWLGITVPANTCIVTPLPAREYARRAMWEGF